MIKILVASKGEGGVKRRASETPYLDFEGRYSISHGSKPLLPAAAVPAATPMGKGITKKLLYCQKRESRTTLDRERLKKAQNARKSTSMEKERLFHRKRGGEEEKMIPRSLSRGMLKRNTEK